MENRVDDLEPDRVVFLDAALQRGPDVRRGDTEAVGDHDVLRRLEGLLCRQDVRPQAGALDFGSGLLIGPVEGLHVVDAIDPIRDRAVPVVDTLGDDVRPFDFGLLIP